MTYAGSAYGAAPYAGAASEGTPGEQYSAEVLADSPSLYWRFSETSGTAVADSSGNARAGTIDNANHTRNAPSLLTTSSDPAMTLTGGNSIVSNEADVAWINIPAFTAEVVFKANSFAGQPLIMAQDNDGVSVALRWRVYVDPATGKLQCVMVNTASAYVTYDTGIVLSTGTTYYVALTYASGTMTFYVNGVAATPYSVDLKASGQAPLRLGGARSFHTSGTYSGTYNGTLDEFAYYPTALSAARIAAHHAAGTGTAAVPAATATGSLTFGGTTGASGAMAATGSLSLGGTGGGEGQATASGSLTFGGTAGAATAAYKSAVLADSPALYYRLNEASGAINDSSGNANTGTWSSGAPTYGVAGLLTGDTDTAAIPGRATSGALAAYETAWTYEMLFKPSSVTVGAGQLANRDDNSNSDQWSMRLSNSTLVLYVRNTALTYYTAEVAGLQVGVRYHITARFNSSTLRVTVWNVDTGALHGDTSTAFVGTPRAISALLRFGWITWDPNQQAQGTYDEIAFYGSALSDARVSAHQYAASNIAPPPPAAIATGSLTFGGTTGASGAMAATGSLSFSGGATSGAEASGAGALELTASVAATAASSFTGSLSLSGDAASAGPPSAAEVVETKAARSASPSVSFTNAMAAGDVVVIAVAGGLNATGATYAASGLEGTWTSEVIANTGNTVSAVLIGRGVSGTGSITVTGTAGPFDFWAFHLRGFPGTVAYTASQSRVRSDATALDRTVGPYGATSGQFIVAAGSAEGASTGGHALTPTSPAKENWTLPAPDAATTGETWSNDGGRIAYRQATTAGDHTVALTGSDSHLALVMLAMDSSAPATGPAAAGSLSFGGTATSGARSVATGALSLAGSATSAARATATGSLAFGGTAGVRAGVQMVHRLSGTFNPITDPTRHFTWSGDFPNAVAGDVLVVFTTETDAPAEWTGPAPWNNNVGNGVLNYGDLGSESFMTPLNTFPVTWRLHVVRLEEHQVSSGGFYLNNNPTAGTVSRITYSMHVLRGVNNFPGTDPINHLSQNDTYYNAQQPVQWAAATATILNPVMTLGIALSDDADVWDGPDGDLWPESPMVVGPQFRHYAHIGFSNQNRAADSDPATAMSWATWQREFTSVPENVSAAGSLSFDGTAGAATGATSSASGSLSFGTGGAVSARAVATGSLALSGSAAAAATATATGSLALSGSAGAAAGATAIGFGRASRSSTARVITPVQPGQPVTPQGPWAGTTGTMDEGGRWWTGSAAGGADPQYKLLGRIAVARIAQPLTPVQGPAPRGGSGSLSLSGSSSARAAAVATGSLDLAGSSTARARMVTTGSLSLSGAAVAGARTGGTGALTLSAAGAAGAVRAAVATGSLALSGSANAQGRFPNNFVDAEYVEILTNGATYTSKPQSNATATMEAGEPTHDPANYYLAKSMWWRYAPASSGLATFDLSLNTGARAGVTIYTGGTVSSLTEVAFDASQGSNFNGLITNLPVTGGVVYHIQVATMFGDAATYRPQVTGPASLPVGTVPIGRVSRSSIARDLGRPFGYYSEEVLVDSPEVYWRLEQQGDALDYSGNGRVGQFQSFDYYDEFDNGGTFKEGHPQVVVDGAHGNGLRFVSSDVRYSDPDDFADTDDFTLEVWFQTEAGAPGAFFNGTEVTTLPIATVGSYGTRSIGGRGSNIYATWGQTNYDSTVVPFSAVNDGGWHMLTLTKSGSTVRFYVDGVQTYEKLAATTYARPVSWATIESTWDRTDLRDPAPAQFDEFSYYSRALSPTQIKRHHDSSLLGDPPLHQTVAIGRVSSARFPQNLLAVQDRIIGFGRTSRSSTARTVTPIQGVAPGTPQFVSIGRATRTSTARPLFRQFGQAVALGRAARQSVPRALTYATGVLYADSFDRSAPVGSPDQGGPYAYPASQASDFTIVDGALRSTSTSTVFIVATVGSELDATFTLKTVGTGGSFVFRHLSASQYWSVRWAAGQGLSLWAQHTSAVATQVGGVVPTGAGDIVRVVVRGRIIQVHLNGRLVLEAEDILATRGTSVGFRFVNDRTSQVDDVTVRSTLPETTSDMDLLDFELALILSESDHDAFIYKGRDSRVADEGLMA